VLIDEAEKVCPEVASLFLQILDYGQLSDGHGRIIDFRNCFIIFTSNMSSSDALHAAELDEEDRRDFITNDTFSLEFVNRLDDIIFFRKLSSFDLEEIMKIRLREFAERMKQEKHVELLIDDDAKRGLWQTMKGAHDARDLDRSFSVNLVAPLSTTLLQHDGEVARVKVNVDDFGVHVAVVE